MNGDTPSQRPSRERLWAHLPAVYRTRDRDAKGALERFVNVLGVGLDLAKEDVLRALDDCFVDRCDPRLIPLIGDLVGISVDPALPTQRQRHQVKYALHWRRRQGTPAQLEALGWQQTGFPTQVREAPGILDRPKQERSAHISGARAVRVGQRTRSISGAVPEREIRITLKVVWPVLRTQRHLHPVGDGVIHAVDPTQDVGLRQADGSPIFYADDPSALVGPGLAIEVGGVDADFPAQGPLIPRFMPLPGERAPYIPARTLAIDPERGRVAGPTPPLPGVEGHRRYLMRFWRPIRAERRQGRPAEIGPGRYTFAGDGRQGWLTDAEGHRLVVVPFDDCRPPLPEADQRLIVTFGDPDLGTQRYVVGPPGSPLPEGVGAPRQAPAPRRGAGRLPRARMSGSEDGSADALAAEAGWVALDQAGLGRFFSILDGFGWDRFPQIYLVPALSARPLHDDAVEVDLRAGRLRTAETLSIDGITVSYFRPFDLDGLKDRGLLALRAAVPLGRRASFTFRDTAPGHSTQGIS